MPRRVLLLRCVILYNRCLAPSSSASNPCLTLFKRHSAAPPPVMEKVLMGIFISFSNVVCVQDNLYDLSAALTCEHVDLPVKETMRMLHMGGGEFLTIKPSLRIKCNALCSAKTCFGGTIWKTWRTEADGGEREATLVADCMFKSKLSKEVS